MADIYGSHFEYGGVSSRNYGLVIATVTSGRNDKLAGDIEQKSIYNKTAKKRYLIDDDTSGSPLSFEVEFVSVDEKPIIPSEKRVIEKWLFNRSGYRKFYLDTADDYNCETYEFVDGVMKRNYLNCRFVNAEKMFFNGGLIGYKATLEADSGMFWQDAITKTFSVQNASASTTSIVSVDVDTDLDDYIYPKVVMTLGSVGGDVTIINNTDDDERVTKFKTLSPYATITMKGDINFVSGQYYEKFSNRNFIRLVDGTNNFTVLGNVATISFEFNNRRAF